MNGVLKILQSSKTGASPSDGLMSYLGYLIVVGVLPSAEIQSVYATAPANWAHIIGYRLSILDMNILNYFIVCKLFVLRIVT